VLKKKKNWETKKVGSVFPTLDSYERTKCFHNSDDKSINISSKYKYNIVIQITKIYKFKLLNRVELRSIPICYISVSLKDSKTPQNVNCPNNDVVTICQMILQK
jgi:hypothetical protein